MPSSNLPPEEQQYVRPFDPLVLDRTMIAIPLLIVMKEDLEITAAVEKTHPEAAQEFNAAIEFNENFPGGVKAAREKVLTMAEDAKDKALGASKKRVERAENEVKASADQLRSAAEGRLLTVRSATLPFKRQSRSKPSVRFNQRALTASPFCMLTLSDAFLTRMNGPFYRGDRGRRLSRGFIPSGSKSSLI
jgi:hypothetical protein